MIPRQFVRRSFPVMAMRITFENIEDVAKWCGGTVSYTGKPHINMTTCKPRPPRALALVGDWVLKSDKGHFKAYRDEAFRLSFEPA